MEWNNAWAAKGGTKRNGVRVPRRQSFHPIPSYSTFFRHKNHKLEIKKSLGVRTQSHRGGGWGLALVCHAGGGRVVGSAGAGGRECGKWNPCCPGYGRGTDAQKYRPPAFFGVEAFFSGNWDKIGIKWNKWRPAGASIPMEWNGI